MNVKTAFLNESLDECIYIAQPGDFMESGNEHKFCKLKKSIYDLRQASRAWNNCFDNSIKTFDFDQCENESCIYKNWDKDRVTFFILYVDDILLIGNNVSMLNSIKEWLSSCFAMKDLGEAVYILGIKLMQDRKQRILGLSQALYIDTILARLACKIPKRDSFLFVIPRTFF